MTQPPQDGYGSPRYRGQRPPPPPVPQQPPPQQLQPRQPPPQPPTAGFGYWDSPSQQLPPQPPPQPPLPPQQPPWESRTYGYEDPYEEEQQEPPAAYGYATVPMGPQRAARSKTKLAVLLAGTIVGMLLAAGGVYYMMDGQGGGAAGAASQEGGAPPEAGSKPGSDQGSGKGSDQGSGQGSDQGSGQGSDQDGEQGSGQDGQQPGDDGAGDSAGGAANGGGFDRRWQAGGGKKLTIGGEVRSGEAAGKNTVSYTDPPDEGTCYGIGDERRSGSVFRMALQCGDEHDKNYIAGDSTRTADELTVEWDEGSRETLTWEGDRRTADE